MRPCSLAIQRTAELVGGHDLFEPSAASLRYVRMHRGRNKVACSCVMPNRVDSHLLTEEKETASPDHSDSEEHPRDLSVVSVHVEQVQVVDALEPNAATL